MTARSTPSASGIVANSIRYQRPCAVSPSLAMSIHCGIIEWCAKPIDPVSAIAFMNPPTASRPS